MRSRLLRYTALGRTARRRAASCSWGVHVQRRRDRVADASGDADRIGAGGEPPTDVSGCATRSLRAPLHVDVTPSQPEHLGTASPGLGHGRHEQAVVIPDGRQQPLELISGRYPALTLTDRVWLLDAVEQRAGPTSLRPSAGAGAVELAAISATVIHTRRRFTEASRGHGAAGAKLPHREQVRPLSSSSSGAPRSARAALHALSSPRCRAPDAAITGGDHLLDLG